MSIRFLQDFFSPDLMIRTCIIVTLVALTACSDDDNDNSYIGLMRYDLELPFIARAGSTDINCEASLMGLGLSGVDASITSSAFYVHDVQLITASGRELEVELDENDFQTSGVALLDFQDKINMCGGPDTKATNGLLAGTYLAIPGTEIESLRFTVGVPEELNHRDSAAAVSPLNRLDLFWNWQGGYKFIRMDIAPVGGVEKDGSTVMTWNFHLGSTGCEGDPELGDIVSCSSPNRPVIELSAFDVDNHAVVFDYAALVAGSTVNADSGGAPGCMSGATDPECEAVFDALGLGIAGASDVTPGQTVFRLIDTP